MIKVAASMRIVWRFAVRQAIPPAWRDRRDRRMSADSDPTTEVNARMLDPRLNDATGHPLGMDVENRRTGVEGTRSWTGRPPGTGSDPGRG